MAVILATTFTLITCARGSLCIIIRYLGNRVQSVVSETLNCEREFKDLYMVGLRKYGTTVGHVLRVIIF